MDAAVAINSVGFELTKQRRLIEAEHNLLSSVELIAKQPHSPKEASIHDSVGYLHIFRKRYREAEESLNKSAQLFQRIGDKAQLVGTLLHLSELRDHQGNTKAAKAIAQRALKLAEVTGLQRLKTDAMNQLASITALHTWTQRGLRNFYGLIYTSDVIDQVITLLKKIARTDETALILGETGTGKELIARAIHLESRRQSGPFVPFNCSSLSTELIESRLFGHKRGAFTGAHADQLGVIRSAEGGTVFLDEIGDLSFEAQGALLRFLQSKEVQPVGAVRPIRVDVRVIAATNRHLREEVKAGRFREDLFYRLRVGELHVPPLWQRHGDVKVLARHFARVYSKENGVPEPVFSREEWRRLEQHDWPGNVRQLESYIKRRIILGESAIEDLVMESNLGTQASRLAGITDNPAGTQPSRLPKVADMPMNPLGTQASRLPAATDAPISSVSLKSQKRSGNHVEWRNLSMAKKRRLLEDALKSNGGNASAAARTLGISRKTAQRLKAIKNK
jgi:transcriptional regulator with GAF, ATPase, and Fis domain